ncbi:MAG: insulinase family protein [Desulfuromonas sp.]|nr:insulinase family protein [Desulfuromonas sp.]
MHDIDSLTDPLWEMALAEGCQLTVLQAAGAQQCALALSLSSGSHDEPAAYLGMAHFLEHLVFRGSQNYAIDDGLMAFVQRNGGQVNAQTQALQTLFHFQVESPLFIEAIQRLVDMLVSPRLEEAMLVSEREVINEEFHLYCQAPQILMDAALAVCLSAAHPLQRFYAGNRQSLSIEDQGFKAELTAFHQAAYLRSKLNIVVVIPHDWSRWKTALLSALQPLTSTVRHSHAAPLKPIQCPKHSALKLWLPVSERYMVLHVPINHSGSGLIELAEKMQHALSVCIGQTFLSYAKEQGWCSGIAVRAPYSGQQQGVLSIEFKLLTDGHGAFLVPAFFAWLRQWREQLRCVEQQAYEQQAQVNRWFMAEPLCKAQQILLARWPLQGLSASCLVTLDKVLEVILSQAFMHVLAGPQRLECSYNKGLPLQVERVEDPRTDTIVAVPKFAFWCGLKRSVAEVCDVQKNPCGALVQHQPVSFSPDLAVCYWGWSVTHPQDVAPRLQARLAPLLAVLSYNAVRCQVVCLHRHVFLRLMGPAEYLPVALNQVLAMLEQPLVEEPTGFSGHFALRRLLQRLPAALVGVSQAVSTPIVTLANQAQSALWLGAPLAIDQLDVRYLQRLQAWSTSASPPPYCSGWTQLNDSGSEDALLIVQMSWPSGSRIQQDQMRLVNKVFSRYFQSVLQRHLRDERGLCYVVFVMPSASAEYAGLVCAVQSSKISAAQILDEIKQCLNDVQGRLTESLLRLRADLLLQAEQLEQQTFGIEALSDMLFRHWREQRQASGFQEEAHAARLLTDADIESYYKAIQNDAQWFVLSNQPAIV